MPESTQPADRVTDRPERTDADRMADHVAIDRLSAELLPALIAKLGATGLGELEVREGRWRVRLRRPGIPAPTGATVKDRRSAERDRERGARPGGAGAPGLGLTPVGPGRDGRDGSNNGRDARPDGPTVATSPAVGIFQPRAEARAGTKVRAGDRLGSVDMLGVPQEVVAPTDGVVGASLVEPGDAVEYGQDLIVIEFATASAAAGAGPSEA
ncbi:MAG: acetyl-CoA carboxylase biotin carboxyl carrier protein [Chloroflexota bacterium]